MDSSGRVPAAVTSHRRSSPAPGNDRVEQDEHGIQLQSSRQHVKHEDILGGQGEVAEVGGGTDGGKARSDIVEGGGDGREDRLQALTSVEESDRQDRDAEDHDINPDIHNDAADRLPLHGLLVHADGRDTAGMDIVMDLLQTGLDQDHDPGHLDAAAGGAGTGADEHDHDQQAA